MPTLNLGVVAHVDAGKTSLTEQLLFHTGVIDRLGAVDDGTTQTDVLALERARGITIRAAVASFRLDDLVVNLIDTPGHPDFIAEVERSLAVLDGAVLVVSAAAGVQAQTRVLFRALRRLGLPVIIFVNKIDIAQQRPDQVVAQIRRRLAAPLVVLQDVSDLGRPSASVAGADPYDWLDLLSEHDPELLRRYVDDPAAMSPDELRGRLGSAARSGAVVPVLFGSAVTGTGVPELVRALPALMPPPEDRSDDPLSGTVFKIETDGSTRISYVRLAAGRLHLRERLRTPSGRRGGKITGIEVYDGGPPQPAEVLRAGQIGRVRGPSELRIGDPIGTPDPRRRWTFDRPGLETVITADPPSGAGALFAALTALAAQDPLIGVRRIADELRVSLFGEVQKEVIEATLTADHGLRVTFSPTTVVCVERLTGVGQAVEILYDDANPFLAGIGLRVEPGPPGSGTRYRVAGDRLGTLPPAFFRAVAETVPDALAHGPHGWPVQDCTVTLIATGYAPRQSHAHATFDKSMSSTAGDFRSLTPLVLAAALAAAGTVVCEPVQRAQLEIPDDTVAAVLSAVLAADGVPSAPTTTGDLAQLEAWVPARTLHALAAQLPGLTRGEGAVESVFDHHAPSRAAAALQGPRPDPDPYRRRDYLLARAGARHAHRV